MIVNLFKVLMTGGAALLLGGAAFLDVELHTRMWAIVSATFMLSLAWLVMDGESKNSAAEFEPPEKRHGRRTSSR